MFLKMPVLWGALFGGLAVALGAFGAHTLQEPLEAWYGKQAATKLATWNTGVEYQMYHALALLFVGLARPLGLGARRLTGFCFIFGILIFSGCLYGLVLLDIKILGAIVPLGGSLLIVGWLSLLVAAWGMRTEQDKE